MIHLSTASSALPSLIPPARSLNKRLEDNKILRAFDYVLFCLPGSFPFGDGERLAHDLIGGFMCRQMMGSEYSVMGV